LRSLSTQQQIELVSNDNTWQHIDTENVVANCDITNDKVIVGTHERAHIFNVSACNHAARNNQLFPFRTVGKKKQIVYLPAYTPKVFWSRTSLSDPLPPGTKYEPYFAVTADSFQGKTVENLSMIYVDIKSLTRPGTLYTAMTRTRVPDNLFVVTQ